MHFTKEKSAHVNIKRGVNKKVNKIERVVYVSLSFIKAIYN